MNKRAERCVVQGQDAGQHPVGLAGRGDFGSNDSIKPENTGVSAAICVPACMRVSVHVCMIYAIICVCWVTRMHDIRIMQTRVKICMCACTLYASRA